MLYSGALTCTYHTTSPGPSLTTDPATLLSESDQATVLPEGRLGTMIRDFWDAHAKGWIKWLRDPGECGGWRFRRRTFLSLIPDPGRPTLDIGCGEGRVGRDLQGAGHRILGVDWSFIMCQAARTYPENPSHAIVGDAANMPLADARVDCAIAFMPLQDIDNMYDAIKGIAHVLEDGPKLALTIVRATRIGIFLSRVRASNDHRHSVCSWTPLLRYKPTLKLAVSLR